MGFISHFNFLLQSKNKNFCFWFTEFTFLTVNDRKLIQKMIIATTQKNQELVLINFCPLSKNLSINSNFSRHRQIIIKHFFPSIIWKEIFHKIIKNDWIKLKKRWLNAQITSFQLSFKKIGINNLFTEIISSQPDHFVNLKKNFLIGDLTKINHLLDYYYFFSGTVVHGNKLARTIGFPTINFIYPNDILLPRDGCFISLVRFANSSKIYFGLTCLMTSPIKNIFETYILDYQSDCYGQKVTVYFFNRYRDNYPFIDMNHLRKWLLQDLKIFKKPINYNLKKII